MKRRVETRSPRAVIALTLVAVGVAGACGSAGPARPGASPSASSGEAKAPPAFTLQDLQGNAVSLADSNGTVRLVDFWATWCAPCREEIPMFKELHATYGGKGFTLIGVAMDDEGLAVVRPFVEKYEMPYLNLLGTEDVANAFGPLRGLPTKFLLDKDGRIVDTFFGPVPKSILEKKIQALL